MTPAAETGRTDEEMRAEIRKAIVAAMPENIPLRGRMARSIMAAVVDPLLSEAAQLRSRLLEAEKGAEAMRERCALEADRHHDLAIVARDQCGEESIGGARWDLARVCLRDLAYLLRELPLNPNQEAGDGR
ncbi:hypothetical protein [Methylobacterium sp. D54C]